MPGLEEVWFPLVDEPIGGIVARVQEANPDLARLVDSPRRVLAFRTFAYIRVGIVLGRLLAEEDVTQYDGSGSWVERLLATPEHREEVEREIRAVAEEIAADPLYSAEEVLGPDEPTRERFRRFARNLG